MRTHSIVISCISIEQFNRNNNNNFEKKRRNVKRKVATKMCRELVKPAVTSKIGNGIKIYSNSWRCDIARKKKPRVRKSIKAKNDERRSGHNTRIRRDKKKHSTSKTQTNKLKSAQSQLTISLSWNEKQTIRSLTVGIMHNSIHSFIEKQLSRSALRHLDFVGWSATQQCFWDFLNSIAQSNTHEKQKNHTKTVKVNELNYYLIMLDHWKISFFLCFFFLLFVSTAFDWTGNICRTVR